MSYTQLAKIGCTPRGPGFSVSAQTESGDLRLANTAKLSIIEISSTRSPSGTQPSPYCFHMNDFRRSCQPSIMSKAWLDTIPKRRSVSIDYRYLGPMACCTLTQGRLTLCYRNRRQHPKPSFSETGILAHHSMTASGALNQSTTLEPGLSGYVGALSRAGTQ
ncbi:hypothetical protein PVE_R2G0941 [Pseudomonas veronii 1YdBTEX2]|uniref:Uncharacterized protein n=1 Tax=Pseudomonas veronii 1YdBTEX2 TaxID=1295141 RepID=A0A1D3K9F2_PSEVE|nr:hypothetical protein PVE_R2G0941 [Pseudomonas veronii 1YdBTEX2]